MTTATEERVLSTYTINAQDFRSVAEVRAFHTRLLANMAKMHREASQAGLPAFADGVRWCMTQLEGSSTGFLDGFGK